MHSVFCDKNEYKAEKDRRGRRKGGSREEAGRKGRGGEDRVIFLLLCVSMCVWFAHLCVCTYVHM